MQFFATQTHCKVILTPENLAIFRFYIVTRKLQVRRRKDFGIKVTAFN